MSAQIHQDPQGLDTDVLLVEDSAQDVELTLWQLGQGGLRCRSRAVETEEDFRRALQERLPDLILSDFTLPGFDGLSALAIANQLAPDVPFIFLSGTLGEERAIEALRRGAVDYVLKSNSRRLVPAVKRALEDAKLRRASRAAERKVARLSGVLKMLSEINAAVARISDREALLQEACRLAHSLGGYPMAAIATVDPPGRNARPVAVAGVLADSAWDRSFVIGASADEDSSLTSRVIRTGKLALCDDVTQSPLAVAGRDELIGAGIRTLACLPLMVDATPVGAILFGATDPGLVSKEELDLLREVAANLSFALQYLHQQDAAHFLAYFDPLTGLAKRTLFCERLGRLLVRGADRLPILAVKVFDIDHLSFINDSFGRHVGDRLLQCVADRLKAHCTDSERLAHLGGGTFVNFVALGESPEEELASLHQEITSLFEAPFVIDGRDIAVSVKCGFACYPQNGQEPNELVQNAEAALKEAKGSGEKYLHHRLEMNAALAERVRLENRLRAALRERQFEVHYQPKVQLQTGRIDSAEALLRWRDPERGLVLPGTFLPILESAGLLPDISAWLLKRVVADCEEWRRAGRPPLRIAINISPAELPRRGFVQEVLEAVGPVASDPERGIDIEVTESALFADSSACVHALRLLRTAGMRVAIDDFGTGYSSLGRLSELPIDSLKIDRIFIQRLPADKRSGTLVATIIELAHAFGMTTIAEGIETDAQRDYLAECGCDEGQGFLFSAALPKAEFELFLTRVRIPQEGLPQMP